MPGGGILKPAGLDFVYQHFCDSSTLRQQLSMLGELRVADLGPLVRAANRQERLGQDDP